MNLDRNRNGELVLRRAQFLNRRHGRLEFPLVSTVVGRGTLPAMKQIRTRPITLKCKVATVVIADENRTPSVELPVLRVQAVFVHRYTR